MFEHFADLGFFTILTFIIAAAGGASILWEVLSGE